MVTIAITDGKISKGELVMDMNTIEVIDLKDDPENKAKA